MSDKFAKDPWHDIARPAVNKISTRLIAEASGGDVTTCWAVTATGNRALLISFPPRYPSYPIPSLKVVEVSKGDDGNTRHILIVLHGSGMEQQFRRLCVDVVEVVTDANLATLEKRIRLCLLKWQHLLASKSLLSAESQKGLISELLFLKRVVVPALGPEAAVLTWSGPLRSPRDFSFGTTYVEVKSNRGSKNHRVKISSEEQLSTMGSEQLFLYVVSLDAAPSGGISLSEVVAEVRSQMQGEPMALGELDVRLAASGYSDDDCESYKHWEESASTVYEVTDGFPRIQSSDPPAGIDRVSYDLDLDYCVEYQSDIQRVVSAIGS